MKRAGLVVALTFAAAGCTVEDAVDAGFLALETRAFPETRQEREFREALRNAHRERREQRASQGLSTYETGEKVGIGFVVVGGLSAAGVLVADTADTDTRVSLIAGSLTVALGGYIVYEVAEGAYDRRWIKGRTEILIGPRGCGLAYRF